MAYQARRRAAYTQDFDLIDETGKVVHHIHVALDPASIIDNLNKRYMSLVQVQREIANINPRDYKHEELIGAYETLGKAVVEMIETVFGEEDTKTILDFYSNRYNDIVLEVIPFIANVVLPDLRKIIQKNKKDILQKYNRKQRRTIMKEWR